MLLNENTVSFNSLTQNFALLLTSLKIGFISGTEIKFVPLFEDLIINQIAYSSRFALSLTSLKIGFISGTEIKFVPLLFRIPLDLHYLCSIIILNEALWK